MGILKVVSPDLRGWPKHGRGVKLSDKATVHFAGLGLTKSLQEFMVLHYYATDSAAGWYALFSRIGFRMCDGHCQDSFATWFGRFTALFLERLALLWTRPPSFDASRQ